MSQSARSLHSKLCALILSLIFSVSLFPASGSAGWFSKATEDHLVPTIDDGFDRTGMGILLGGLTLVTLSQNYDAQVREQFSGNQRMSHSTSRVGDLLGTGVPGALIAIGQLQWDTENGEAHAEALLASLAVTSLLKASNQRTRPNSDNRHAMPSGHTSTAFTTATHLAYAYGWKAAVPGYLASTFVAVSRWSDDAHWLSDTVAGATIGIFWGRATWFHHSRISPIVLDDGGGLGLGYTLAY